LALNIVGILAGFKENRCFGKFRVNGAVD